MIPNLIEDCVQGRRKMSLLDKAPNAWNSAGAGEQQSSSDGMKLREMHFVQRPAGMTYSARVRV